MLIGAGGQASEVLDMYRYNYISGYVVDTRYGKPGDVVGTRMILGDLAWLREQKDVVALCAVGYPQPRCDLVQRAGDIEWFSAIHPEVTISGSADIGKGCIVAAGVILMNDVVVGDHVLLNIGSSVSHGSRIGDFCTLSPGARIAGNCVLDPGVFVGMNASVVERVRIGAWARIGAGAVVLEDVPPGVTVVGIPGRVV